MPLLYGYKYRTLYDKVRSYYVPRYFPSTVVGDTVPAVVISMNRLVGIAAMTSLAGGMKTSGLADVRLTPLVAGRYTPVPLMYSKQL